MNLYQIQETEEPLFVMAKDMGDAIEKWRKWLKKQSGVDFEDQSNQWPEGINVVCSDADLIQ